MLWAQGKMSAQVLLTTLSVAGGRAMQVYTSANFTRARVRPHSLAHTSLRLVNHALLAWLIMPLRWYSISGCFRLTWFRPMNATRSPALSRPQLGSPSARTLADAPAAAAVLEVDC